MAWCTEGAESRGGGGPLERAELMIGPRAFQRAVTKRCFVAAAILFVYKMRSSKLSKLHAIN